jgi:hypothetical protein
MIKAVLRDGQIQPLAPLPANWENGQTLQVQQTDDLRDEFARLAAIWKDETRFLSSTTDIATHPAYQRIIGLGMPAVPLILEQLRQEPRPWFWALRAITGEDPVPTAAKGKVREMADIWLNWAADQGLIETDESTT